jgi:hypothetical protein
MLSNHSPFFEESFLHELLRVNRMLRNFLIISLLLGMGHSFLGCATPVIPLPPPPLDRINFSILDPSQKSIVIRGTLGSEFRGLYVFLLNQRTRSGSISQADLSEGSFESNPLEAEDKDEFLIWASKEVEDPPGESACFELDFSSNSIKTCAGSSGQ